MNKAVPAERVPAWLAELQDRAIQKYHLGHPRTGIVRCGDGLTRRNVSYRCSSYGGRIA